MALWTKEELLAGSQGEMQGNWQALGLSIDSREIAEGDLFIALKAARDGHEFVKMALEKGAAGALVSHVPEGCENANLLIVDDVEAAMARMGQYRRAQVCAKIVAVTGSVGKTSTKEMLLTALSQYGSTHASVKSFNNHWGVPLTLARMPRDTQYGVFEIGMNHPGEIAPLVAQVRPDVAVITNIAPVHLEGFENEDGIAREKASILEGLDENGVGIINGDMKYRDFVAELSRQNNQKIKLKYFGENASNDIIAEAIDITPEQSHGVIKSMGASHSITLPVAGHHHIMNALIVVGVLQEFDLDPAPALEALKSWLAPSGRGQKFTISSEFGQIKLVDESYNANPLSMRSAIEAFLLVEGKRHIAILGDMKELGPNSKTFHQELSEFKGLQALDQVHLVGQEMLALYYVLPANKGLSLSLSLSVLHYPAPPSYHPSLIVEVRRQRGNALGGGGGGERKSVSPINSFRPLLPPITSLRTPSPSLPPSPHPPHSLPPSPSVTSTADSQTDGVLGEGREGRLWWWWWWWWWCVLLELQIHYR